MGEANPEIGIEILADGLRTNVLDSGADPGGGVVLLLHGSGPGVSAWSNWRLAIPALSERFRVIAPDIAGFGYTERDGRPTTMSAWTSHAVGVLDALGIESAHVVGNSFGGTLALSLAIRHPERVRRLALMGSVGAPFEITPGLDAVWGYEPSVEAMDALIDLFAYDRSKLPTDLAEVRYRASIRPGVQESYAPMFPAPRQQALDAVTQNADDLAAVAHETLIVHGREDRIIPLSAGISLFELIPNSQLHVFGKCGHWTQIEHASRFNRLLADFLGGD